MESLPHALNIWSEHAGKRKGLRIVSRDLNQAILMSAVAAPIERSLVLNRRVVTHAREVGVQGR